MEQGDKVHYTSLQGKKENGIVKSVNEESAFVVYNCAGEWDKYMNYTGQYTALSHLKPGWIDENEKNPQQQP